MTPNIVMFAGYHVKTCVKIVCPSVVLCANFVRNDRLDDLKDRN